MGWLISSLSTEFSAERSWRHPFGPRFSTSPISVITAWCSSLKTFCTRH